MGTSKYIMILCRINSIPITLYHSPSPVSGKERPEKDGKTAAIISLPGYSLHFLGAFVMPPLDTYTHFSFWSHKKENIYIRFFLYHIKFMHGNVERGKASTHEKESGSRRRRKGTVKAPCKWIKRLLAATFCDSRNGMRRLNGNFHSRSSSSSCSFRAWMKTC